MEAEAEAVFVEAEAEAVDGLAASTSLTAIVQVFSARRRVAHAHTARTETEHCRWRFLFNACKCASLRYLALPTKALLPRSRSE